jgi:hypothetical protein
VIHAHGDSFGTLLTNRHSNSFPEYLFFVSSSSQRQSVIDSSVLPVRYSERMCFGVENKIVQTYLIRIGEDEIEVLQRFS